MNHPSIIEMKGVSYTYPDGTQALQGIDIRLPQGAKIVFLGSNGAGKSTLFQLFNGIIKIQKGEYLFDNELVKYDRKSLLKLRQQIGVVFQEPDNQIFANTVFEEVSFGPMNMGIGKAEVLERVQQAMFETEITEHSHKPAHLLSYGQKKRVTIASVLSMQPAVIVLDEPISGLDPLHAKAIIHLINNLNNKGKTIILSTHDVNLAYTWADFVVVMKNGAVLKSGNCASIFADNQLLNDAGLEKPLLLEVYEKVKHINGCESMPKSKYELLNMLEGLQ